MEIKTFALKYEGTNAILADVSSRINSIVIVITWPTVAFRIACTVIAMEYNGLSRRRGSRLMAEIIILLSREALDAKES